MPKRWLPCAAPTSAIPNNLEILGALISINREAGDRQAALRYARQAAVLLPDNANLARLVAELEGK